MLSDYYKFKPNFIIRNGFVQTIIGSQCFGQISLPKRKVHKIEVDKQSKLILLELPSQNYDAPIVLLAHGMGGCSESGYMRRIARKLWIRGLNVFMMNQRGCGLGMGLSKRLWNGGVSDDLDKVVGYISKLRQNKLINVIGFSLSGNILLKYLGEKSKQPLKISKAFAVNPPIDLRMSSHIISRSRGGILFNWYYMKHIHRQGEALAECFPGVFLPSGEEKTILEFDETYTAPAAGYKDVDDYYAKCSAKGFLESITVPTTILCPKDDPFIRLEVFKSIRWSNSIEMLTPDHGGHMGYILNRPTSWGDYRWMDFLIGNWAEDARKVVNNI